MVIRINKIILLMSAFISLSVFITVLFCAADNASQATSSTPSREIPIIMYHHITEHKDKAGKYTVTETELEEDLKYIKKIGYQTVTVEDLINFVEGKQQLPEKIIMITFDDGFESVYAIAFNLLKKYEMRAVVSVIGKQADIYSEINDHNINYSNLTWNEIKEMNESNIIEIQSHTYNLHKNGPGERKGIIKIQGESTTEYRKILSDDLNKMKRILKEKAQVNSNAIAIPFGAYTNDTISILKELGFKCTLTCDEKISTITADDKDTLFQLGRFNRPSGIATENFFARLNVKTA